MTSPASISTQSQFAQALDAKVRAAGVLEVADQPIGDGADVALRTAGGDDHVVGERRLAGDVDGDGVLGLGVFETGEDHLQGVRRCEFTAGGRKTRNAASARPPLRSAVVSVRSLSPTRRPGCRRTLKDRRDDGDAFKTQISPLGVAGAQRGRGERRCAGRGRKTQAGGWHSGQKRRHPPRVEPRSAPAARAAGEASGRASATPGRLKTAIGIISGDAPASRASGGRWRRLSAPIIQTQLDARQARQQAAQASRRCSGCRARPRRR